MMLWAGFLQLSPWGFGSGNEMFGRPPLETDDIAYDIKEAACATTARHERHFRLVHSRLCLLRTFVRGVYQ